MIGYFERIYGLNAEGWACNELEEQESISLFVIDSSGKVVGTGVTQLQRPDVYKAKGIGLGSGFSIRIEKKCNLGPIKIIDRYGNELPSNRNISSPKYFPDWKIDNYIGKNNLKYTNISIFIFAPIDWEIRFQRPQQLAVYLAQIGYRVFYVQPRLGFDAKGISFVENHISDSISTIRIHINKQASTTLDLDRLDLHDISTGLISFCQSASKNVFVIQHPLWHGIIDQKISNTTYIFDFLDDVSGVKGEHGLKSLPYQKKIIKYSDFVVATSDHLRTMALKDVSHVYLAPNGASRIFLSFNFRTRVSKNTFIYIGAIEDWFDFELINFVMSKDRHLKLIIVGDCQEIFKKNFHYNDRIKFLGEVDHFALPKIMKLARVGIIPFKTNDFTKTIDAVKKYEYIMSGLPVIASGIVGDRHFKDHLKICNNNNRFFCELKHAMNSKFINTLKGKMLAYRKNWHKQLSAYQDILKYIRINNKVL